MITRDEALAHLGADVIVKTNSYNLRAIDGVHRLLGYEERTQIHERTGKIAYVQELIIDSKTIDGKSFGVVHIYPNEAWFADEQLRRACVDERKRKQAVDIERLQNDTLDYLKQNAKALR